MVLIYFIVAFVVFFITYKLRIEKFREESYEGEVWVERQTFWVLLFVPVFWMISVPAIVAWVVLDKIYNKLTNKNNN